MWKLKFREILGLTRSTIVDDDSIELKLSLSKIRNTTTIDDVVCNMKKSKMRCIGY